MSKVEVKLFPHQVEGVEFLRKAKRAILADSTGTGKTITSLAAAKGRTLVVCPKRVGAKWVESASLFGTAVGVLGNTKAQKTKQAGLSEGAQFVVTNYETLSSGIDVIVNGDWDTVIADEAQNLQGRKSKRSTIFKKMVRNSELLFLLTATPVWNMLDSLWNLLNTLYPKEWSSYWRFVSDYCLVKITPFGTEIVGFNQARLPDLKLKMEPYLLRRDKKDILSLPEQTVHEVWLDVDKRLLRESRNLRKQMRDYGSNSLERARVHLLDRNIFDFQGDERLYAEDIKPAKKQALVDLLDTHRGEKVLLFVCYRRSAALVHSWVRETWDEWICPDPITGEIPLGRRQEWLTEFTGVDGGAVLVGTIATLGTGVDGLQCASTAVFVEHPSMYTELDQCIGRIERIGSDRAATIYHLVQKGTIDQKVWMACQGRQHLSEAVLLRED